MENTAPHQEGINSMDINPALDIDDLLNKSKKVGEGIADYKNRRVEKNHSFVGSNNLSSDQNETFSQVDLENCPIDFKGVGALNSLLYENSNLKSEEIRNTIKAISEDQVRSHILRIQKELSLLGKCLNQMDYKYLSLKTSYASKDLDQILEVFKKKHLH